MASGSRGRRRRASAPGSPGRAAGAAPVPAGGERAEQLVARLPVGVWVLFIALAVAFYFYPLVFAGKVFSSADAQAPQGFAVYAEAWRAKTGEYPLWNPFLFCGFPSFAALAYNPDIYFPDWIFTLLGGLAPPMLWLIIYYAIGAIALFVLLADQGAARGPAALGGLVFALTPNLVAVGAHGHGSQLVNSGLMPVALLALHRFLTRGRGIWLALLALTIGCQVLRGHVQIAYYTWLLVGLYICHYLLARRQPDARFAVAPRRALAGVAVALLLGALLGAVLALPVAAYAPHSIRGGGATGGVSFEYATGWSLGPGELWTLIVPSALGFGGETYWGTMPFTDYPNAYVGIITLAFAVFAFIGPRGRSPQPVPRAAAFYLALAVFGLLVALGKHFVLYDLLYRVLPYWKKFRVPVMILVLSHLALAGLLALGLTRIAAAAHAGSGTTERWARLFNLKAVILVAILVLGVVLAGGFRDAYSEAFRSSPRISTQLARAPDVARQLAQRAAGRAHTDLLKNIALVAVASALSGLVLRRRLRPGLYVGGIALLAAIDLVPVGQEVMQPLVTARADLVRPTAPDEIVIFLQAQPGPFRVYPIEEFRSNRLATFGIASVGGYHAAKPRIYQEFMDAFGLETLELFSHPDRYRLLDLLNVRYLVTAADIGDNPRFRRVYEGPIRVYENTMAGPRAFLVGEVEVVHTTEEALARLADPGFDFTRRALVSADVGPLGGTATTGTVTITEHELNTVVVDVVADAPGLLVLGDLYDPGWQVRVDGNPEPVLRVDHIFRGVRVDRGVHRVEFRYVAPGLRLGLGLSLTAGVAILGLALVSLARGRRLRREAAG